MKFFSMQRLYTGCKLTVAVMMAVSLYSCRPTENGIDNNQVKKKPYTLYACDTLGTLYNSNDGVDYKDIVFTADGYPSRAIHNSGDNLLWVKANSFVSENNGKNFNPTHGTPVVSPVAFDNSMIQDVPAFHRVYMSSTQGAGGCVYSDSNGRRNTWRIDDKFDAGVSVKFTSFTLLPKGTVVAYDHIANKLFTRTNKDDNWKEQTGGTALPSGAWFYLSHFNNTVVAADRLGVEGVWYSDNDGKDWAKYNGVPSRPITAIHAPFDKVLMVGTDSLGVFIFENGTFKATNEGLEDRTVVRGITSKYDLYKNDVRKQYIYLATSKGIYRSVDLGQNWILVKPGNYVNIY